MPYLSGDVGEVKYFAMETPPAGWLKANGAALDRTAYSRLFARIGTIYGAGDGSTTFNAPDLRGEFLRGFDDGRGVDAGRAFGSGQGDAIRNITSGNTVSVMGGAVGLFTHKINAGNYAAGGDQVFAIGDFNASFVVPTAAENRPRNIALLACIKY